MCMLWLCLNISSHSFGGPHRVLARYHLLSRALRVWVWHRASCQTKKKKILSVSITVLRLSCCFTLRVHIVQRSVCQTERAKEEEGIAAGGWQESVEEAVWEAAKWTHGVLLAEAFKKAVTSYGGDLISSAGRTSAAIGRKRTGFCKSEASDKYFVVKQSDREVLHQITGSVNLFLHLYTFILCWGHSYIKLLHLGSVTVLYEDQVELV